MREAAIVVASFALCVLGGVLQVDGTLGAPPATVYALAVVSAGVLALRRRTPATALALTMACGLAVAPLGLLLTPLIVAPVLVAVYTFAVRTERRVAIAVVIPAAMLLVIFTPLFEDAFSWEDVSRLVTVTAAVLVAGLLGCSLQDRRAYLAAMVERAQRAESTRDSEARLRVEEERVRIARELHDVVAHQITLANAQAMVAVQLFDARPTQARASLQNVVETTGHALDDLRATLGLLREVDEAADPAEPAPGLAQLTTLLESFRRAGLEVSVHEEGTPTPLPPGTDLTAYRIIQEALTNVTKHAGTRTARVGLDWGRTRLLLTVADDGRARPSPLSGSTPGFGLIGMRERAAAIGGLLDAGHRPEGGFLVSTELPLPARKPSGPTARENSDG